MAVTDPLTGLYNRRHFFTLAKQEAERSVRYSHALSVIIIDLDDFKQNRQLIRARLGLDATISDSLRAGFQVSTGNALDPRAANATLGDSNQRKEFRLSLAHVDWTIFDGAVLTAGKQRQPWFRPGSSLFYDSDVNPEGVALRWRGRSGAFANAWGFWLSESFVGADANLFGAQVGWETAFGLTVTTLVEGGILSLPQAIARLTSEPARIFRLPKESLSVGADADVTIVDPTRE